MPRIQVALKQERKIFVLDTCNWVSPIVHAMNTIISNYLFAMYRLQLCVYAKIEYLCYKAELVLVSPTAQAALVPLPK